MKHPGPLLPDYVDGTLAPDRRAVVETHLQTCAACRAEVDLARAGRAAAAALPPATVPSGVADEAIAEAAHLARDRAPNVASIHAGRRATTTPRWFAALGVAAVLVLGILIVPKLGQPGTTPSMEAAGDAAGPAADASRATAVEFQRVDYGADLIQRVALTFGRTPQEAAAGGVAADASATSTLSPGTAYQLPSKDLADKLLTDRLPAAQRCLARAYPTDGVLHRVILARYQGAPAYIGLYLQGPGAGLPPERVLVVVAATDGCTLLTTQQVALP